MTIHDYNLSIMEKRILFSSFILLTIFSVTSCVLFLPSKGIDTEYLKQVSTVHYEITGENKLPIRTDGYYRLANPDKDMVPGYERINVFYDSGSFASYLINSDGQDSDIIDMEVAIKAAKPLRNVGAYYGVYKISNDTIYANTYTKSLYLRRLYFLITDSNTITAFKEDAPLQVYNGEIAVWDDSTKKYCFARAINIPKPNDYFLRKKAWMWK